MTITLTRRGLLLSGVSLAAASALPAFPAAAPVASVAAVKPVLPMWIVGTPGEYDWRPVAARTLEEAFAEYCWQQGGDPADDVDPDCVQRVDAWDGRDPDTITGADWFGIGWGHCCERCWCETSPDSGGVAVAGEVVCEECLTPPDRAICEPDQLVEELENDICDVGAEAVRARLVARGHWQGIPPEIWDRAVAGAQAWLAREGGGC
jgi:hypothetical protein